jgi:hypothetical protein
MGGPLTLLLSIPFLLTKDFLSIPFPKLYVLGGILGPGETERITIPRDNFQEICSRYAGRLEVVCMYFVDYWDLGKTETKLLSGYTPYNS